MAGLQRQGTWSALLLLTTGALGCTGLFHKNGADAGAAPPICQTPYAGEKGQPVQLDVITLGLNNEVLPVTEGSGIPLMLPPQGGRVSWVGVRANNMDPCTVQLTGALTDPHNSQLRLDSRTINLRITDGGVAASSAGVINLWANIPLCPNQWASQDIFGNTFKLDISITERDGRMTSRSMNVVPFCGQPDEEDTCKCICKGGYMLGESCVTPDGGVVDSGVMDASTVWDAG